MTRCFAIFASLISGCTISDVSVYVVGEVVNELGQSIEGATVEYIYPKATSHNGCFAFNGIYSSKPIKFVVAKEGYKTYTSEWKSDYYRIRVTLAKEESDEVSEATWTVLDESYGHKIC